MLPLCAAASLAVPLPAPPAELSPLNAADMREANRAWDLALAEERAAASRESTPFLGLNAMRMNSSSTAGSSSWDLAAAHPRMVRLGAVQDEAQVGLQDDHLFSLTDTTPLLQAYRQRIQQEYGDLSRLPPTDYPHYNLCGMCHAMFRLGKCASPKQVTKDVVQSLKQTYVELATNTTILDMIVHAAAGQGIIDAPRRNRITLGTSAAVEQKLKCEDDSQIWWDTCSVLPCMNGMAGIDSRCKYRVAPDSLHVDSLTGVDGSDPFLGSIEEASKHFVRRTKLTALPGGVADFTSLVTLQLGMHTFSSTYFHTHCGAGMDLRGISMACHFPRKRWCTQLGALAHYRECKKLFCDSCLWTCKKKTEDQAIYPPSTSLLDTILPQECVQDVDTLEANVTFRRAVCDDPSQHFD
jgi:hypothetical protein